MIVAIATCSPASLRLKEIDAGIDVVTSHSESRVVITRVENLNWGEESHTSSSMDKQSDSIAPKMNKDSGVEIDGDSSCGRKLRRHRLLRNILKGGADIRTLIRVIG